MCDKWEECSEDGWQSRKCVDWNDCGTTDNMPITYKSCEPVVKEEPEEETTTKRKTTKVTTTPSVGKATGIFSKIFLNPISFVIYGLIIASLGYFTVKRRR